MIDVQPRRHLCVVATAAAAFLLALRAGHVRAQIDQPRVTHEDKVQLDELISWVHSLGGYVADGVGFGYENSIRGLVAGSKGFKAGDVMFDILNDCIMLPIPSTDNPGENDQCAQIHRLHQELNKGEESYWWKYLRMDDSLGVRSMALWDDAVLDELQGLPPYRPRLLLQWYAHWCKNNENTHVEKSLVTWYHKNLSKNEKQALWIFHTRRSNTNGLVPIWDLANHNNGLLNMIAERYEGGMRYKALVDILPGETIHNSYGSRTSDRLFRDYGFVESLPQTWSWCSSGCTNVYDNEEGETRHRFVLLPNGVAAIEPESGETVCVDCVDTLVLEDFVAAARVLLDGLPTSVEEDVVILNLLKNEMRSVIDWKPTTMLDADVDNNSNVRLADTIVAVEYRTQFKQAVHAALVYGARQLDQRRKEL